MVSKLGFFFLAKAFCYLLHALWGPSCWDSSADAKSLSQALSTSTGATSRALKWLAKTIVGKATMKKPRSNVVLPGLMQYASTNIGQSQVVAMVHLFVSLQGGRTI
jgi:hypothetical protein